MAVALHKADIIQMLNAEKGRGSAIYMAVQFVKNRPVQKIKATFKGRLIRSLAPICFS